ncbi:MAG: hypothetical protein ACO2PN_29280 [Pyrobaculum sp.]
MHSVRERRLIEGLAEVMDARLLALSAVLSIRPVKKYITRVKLRGGVVTSLVYWVATEWDGCEFYVKIYRKWGVDGVLRPVVGLSHVALCGGRLLYYPAVDVDSGKTPPKRYMEQAIVYWEYVSAAKGRRAWHIVLSPVFTKSQAIKLMRRYDDNRHLKYAHMPRKADYFDFAVLRVSSYAHWRECVTETRFSDDPMARLHKYLRHIYWAGWSRHACED